MLKLWVSHAILFAKGPILEYILVFNNNVISKSAKYLFKKSLIWGYSDRTIGGEVDNVFKMCYFMFKFKDYFLFYCR